jgi:undecaprenyl-diphosphatase
MNKSKIWLIVIPITLFILLAISVMAGITVNFEGWAYSEAVEKMSPWLTILMTVITHMGDPAVVIILCMVLFLIPQSRNDMAFPVSLTVIVSAILNVILKNIFARARPDILQLINETSYSFPSGHSMINASLYTILIIFIFKNVRNKTRKITLTAVCIVLPLAIGYSRIYLGVHFLGDVVGGWLIGFAVAVLTYFYWGRHAGKPTTKRAKDDEAKHESSRPAG